MPSADQMICSGWCILRITGITDLPSTVTRHQHMYKRTALTPAGCLMVNVSYHTRCWSLAGQASE